MLEQECLADDQDLHDECPPGCCCRMAAPAGALADLPEIGRIEVEIGAFRCRDALSRA